MRNVYQHVIIGFMAFTLLGISMTVDIINTALESRPTSSSHSLPHFEKLAGAQAGAYHQWSSEEIGRGLVPQVRTVQW